jgi:endonuclease IV
MLYQIFGKHIGGTVLHIGAKGPLSQVIKEINDLDIHSNLYLENAAQFKKLGSTLEDLRLLKEGIDSKKVGFCWDTCHLHSSGVVDMRNPDKVIEFFEEMKDIGVKSHQGVVHLNDSKTPFKSGQDRHSILGYGYIWNVEKPESMESLFALRDICKENSYDIILETPSIDINKFEFSFL